MLYNTAEMDRGPLGEGDTVAILEGTQLCCTRQLRDLLHCLGGIPVLLPLFAQLGTPSHTCAALICTVAGSLRAPLQGRLTRRGMLKWVEHTTRYG